MTQTNGQREGTSVKHVARISRRRKLPFILALILVPTPAIFFSLREPAAYSATADVILSRVNLAATLTGTSDPNVLLQPGQIALTEANVARVPLIAKRTDRRDRAQGRDAAAVPEGLVRDPGALDRPAAVLVRRTRPGAGATSRTQYAIQYKRFRHELDTAGIERLTVN